MLPKALQVLIGHKDIRVTMDTYGQLYDGADEAAIAQFEKFLDEQRAPSAPHEDLKLTDATCVESAWSSDGAYRDRTGDLRLAKPALSQLS